MISQIEKLPGLPGDSELDIHHYSPDGKGEFREGVVVKFSDDQGHEWIGNFQPLGFLRPHLFSTGIAIVCAGPNCYVVTSSKSHVLLVKSECSGSEWQEARPLVIAGKNYLLLLGSGGTIAMLNDGGRLTGKTHVDGCDGVRFERFIGENILVCSGYSSLTKEWTEEKFTLPDLMPRVN